VDCPAAGSTLHTHGTNSSGNTRGSGTAFKGLAEQIIVSRIAAVCRS
jgi:hypothetical protein